MNRKSFDKVPIVAKAYITVMGKFDDIIRFAKLATEPAEKPRVTFFAPGKKVKYFKSKRWVDK